MTTFIFVIMILSWIIFIISVLLMSPKWGLWFGITGISTSNEYSSKKSVESTLKKSAFFSIIVFTLLVIVYPYIAKKQLSNTNYSIKQSVNQNVSWDIIKLEWINVSWQNINNKKIDNIFTWNTTK